MPMYVMVEFDNDADAVVYLRDMAKRNEVVIEVKPDPVYPHIIAATARPRGLWKVPTEFCAGPGDGHMKSATARTKGGRLRRGKKWGWHICVDCGKPSPGHVEHELRTSMNLPELGFNLLSRKFNPGGLPWLRSSIAVRIEPKDEE